VALAVVSELSKGEYINRSHLLGGRLQDKLQALSRETEQIKEVRGKGLMIAIEFNGANDQPAATIHDRLFEKGYIASLRRGQNTLRIDPPLITEEAILDSFVGELRNVLEGLS
jgi:4-aminobutyrate aminotransferase-like enzyme